MAKVSSLWTSIYRPNYPPSPLLPTELPPIAPAHRPAAKLCAKLRHRFDIIIASLVYNLQEDPHFATFHAAYGFPMKSPEGPWTSPACRSTSIAPQEYRAPPCARGWNDIPPSVVRGAGWSNRAACRRRVYPTNTMAPRQPSINWQPHAEALRPGRPGDTWQQVGRGDEFTFDAVLASIDRLSGWVTSWITSPDPKRFDYAVF